MKLIKRLREHLKEITKNIKFKNHNKVAILRTSKENGHDIIIEELESIEDNSYAKKIETYWICQFISWGFNLTNKLQRNNTINHVYPSYYIKNGDETELAYKIKIKRIWKSSYIKIADRDENYKGYWRPKTVKKISLNKKEMAIIRRKKRIGDCKRISKLSVVGTEMIRLCLKQRRMRVEIYEAIKKYYEF